LNLQHPVYLTIISQRIESFDFDKNCISLLAFAQKELIVRKLKERVFFGKQKNLKRKLLYLKEAILTQLFLLHQRNIPQNQDIFVELERIKI